MKLWKKKYIWIYMAVVLLLLAGCLVLCLQSRESMSYQGMHTFEHGQATDVVVYENISLNPGVYRIGLQYDTDKDYAGLCNVLLKTDNPRALFTNGEHLYAGLGSTGYQLWLFEATDDLQILVSYGGEGSLSTKDLVIANTGQLWTMIAMLVMCLALAGMVFVVYIEYDKCYKVSRRTKEVIVFLALITVVASWAQFRNSLLSGADLTYHLQRIEGVKDALSTGQFPVRIEPKWLYNHGYADAIFYCNTFLYLPAFFRLAGFTVTISYNIFCIALNLATAWIAWYVFDRIFRDYRIGLMCSALYTLSFIRIYKLVIVGAVGEGSAITFLPLIFYGLYRIFAEDVKSETYKTAWLPVAFGYAGVIQCHVLTCEITAFLTILVCLVCIRKVLKRQVFMALAKGALGAAGLSLWYLVPFLDYYLTQNMHIRHVAGRTIQERGLYPAQLLLNSWSDNIQIWLVEKGLEHVEAGCVGTLFLVAVAVFVVLWMCGCLRNLQKSLQTTGKLSVVLACVLMLMSLRVFPWDRIQASHGVAASLVSSLQFPNRFLGWATVFLCMVFGVCIYTFCNYRRNIAYIIGTGVTVLSVVTGSVYLLHHTLQSQDSFMLHNEESMGCGYISGAEYLVEGTNQSLLTFAGPVPGDGVSVDNYVKNGLKASLYCINEGVAESYVELPILLYKGYRAYGVNNSELTIQDGSNHLVRVIVPGSYEGEISVQFESPWYWRVAELITVIALVAVVADVLRTRKFTPHDATKTLAA
ncbi:MAG: hypothetical protein E7292_06320 [Lachnospiraceae bacterium]|nr:hypothetical protein [Lachnospiraceae bacterium]